MIRYEWSPKGTPEKMWRQFFKEVDVSDGQKNDISKQLPRQLASASHPLPPAPEKTATLGGDLSYTKTTFIIKESELQNQEKTY